MNINYQEFELRRSALGMRLDRAKTIGEAVAMLCAELDTIHSRVLDRMTAQQARLAAQEFELLKQAISALVTANRTSVWRPESITSDTDRSNQNLRPVMIRALQGVICIGLILGIIPLANLHWFAWPAIPLVAMLPTLEFVLWYGSAGALKAVAGRIDVQVNSSQLLDHVGAAMNVIDRTLALADSPQPARPNREAMHDGIDSIPELLELLQNMLSETIRGDESLVFKRSQEIPVVLARYGVQVASFVESDRADRNKAALFEFEPSLDPNASDYQTLRPALVRDGRPLARGRVAVPHDLLA